MVFFARSDWHLISEYPALATSTSVNNCYVPGSLFKDLRVRVGKKKKEEKEIYILTVSPASRSLTMVWLLSTYQIKAV